MTDPNKAAVTESNSEFIKVIKAASLSDRKTGPNTLRYDEIDRLIALAEERVMIEEHRLTVIDNGGVDWEVIPLGKFGKLSQDLSTALRAVVAKIGEGNVS